MKRTIAWLAALALALIPLGALADGMGVQIIGGPEIETEPVSLDDIQIGIPVDIDGYATVNVKEYIVKDHLGRYFAGNTVPSGRYPDYLYVSGNDAEYVVLYVDLINLSTKDKNFLEECEVQAVYDDLYIYGGWAYQQNYNNSPSKDYYDDNKLDQNEQNMRWAIDPEDNFAVGPMYSGHYIFGCTLPNAVIEGKKPLRLVITIDGNEITYNIRK